MAAILFGPQCVKLRCLVFIKMMKEAGLVVWWAGSVDGLVTWHSGAVGSLSSINYWSKTGAHLKGFWSYTQQEKRQKNQLTHIADNKILNTLL